MAAVKAASTAARAPVVLRAPPFRWRVPELARVSCAWDGIAPAGASADHPAIRALLEARVGGTFWAPSRPSLPHGALTLLSLPDDPVAARLSWQAALAAGDAARLVVLLPARGRRPEAGPGLQAVARAARTAGSMVLDGPIDPYVLLDAAREIRLPAIDDLGVLGLLAGIPVIRQGDGDNLSAQAEMPGRAVALLLDATRYIDPFSGRPGTLDEAVALLADWKRIIRLNRGIGVCVGMSLWKRRRIGELFATAGTPQRFRRHVGPAIRLAQARGGAIAVWSTRAPAELTARAASAGVALARVEDGFVRSLGLGSDLLPPASIIVDGSGIYFDPSRPSDLETLLADTRFDDALRARARRLIDLLVARNISKYASGGEAPRVDAAPGRRVVLVPGQVADDLSVRLGGGEVRGNLELLRRVRAAEPDAFIIYRPHPDVDAGHRLGALADATVRGLADQVSRGGSIAALIGAVDEVHTLTSLAGFEALLRGKRVVTYGQPFYAGWGLTEDRAPIARRRRRLLLEELAAATLILYPRYVDPLTRLPCGPEVMIGRLAEATLWRPTALMRLRRLQGRIRRHTRDGRLGMVSTTHPRNNGTSTDA